MRSLLVLMLLLGLGGCVSLSGSSAPVSPERSESAEEASDVSSAFAKRTEAITQRIATLQKEVLEAKAAGKSGNTNKQFEEVASLVETYQEIPALGSDLRVKAATLDTFSQVLLELFAAIVDEVDSGALPTEQDRERVARQGLQDCLQDSQSARIRFTTPPQQAYSINEDGAVTYCWALQGEVNPKTTEGSYVGFMPFTVFIRNGELVNLFLN